MRYRWPEDTQFTPVILTVEQEVCALCQRHLHVCDHRFHPILSLQGPLQLVCKLAHCPDPCCPAHHHTLSPFTEARITLRLPESLKAAVEAAASREGLSVNTWLLQVLARSVETRARRGGHRLTGFARS